MRAVTIVVACLLALFAVRSSASAQDARLDGARARWERLSPDEQARLRERFERLRSMPERERASLEDRARSLSDAMNRAQERLPAEDRARVDRLDPERRRALLRDLALLEGGDCGTRSRGHVPGEWREKLDRLPPDQRAQAAAEFERKQREHCREKLAEILARKFELSAAEIARIEALPESERVVEIAKLRRADRGPERDAAKQASMSARMKLFQAARPRVTDHVRYAELATGERRQLVAKIVRERVIGVLRESALATADEIDALEKLSLDEFQRALRERLRAPRGRHGDPHGGPQRR